MAITRGYMEILQLANGNAPKSFGDFTKIPMKKGFLSSATVSKRLDQLISVDALKEIIVRSKNGRRIIAYRTTDKGKRVIAIVTQLEEILSIPNKK
ncbi:MAG: hypothetical protein ACYCO0_01330 [Candidatus Micrarchaeaceae archaeon]